MPHPELYEVIDRRSRITTTRLMREHDGNPGCSSKTTATTVDAGSVGSLTLRRLARSQSSKPDASGWRAPTPYWGTIRTQNWYDVGPFCPVSDAIFCKYAGAQQETHERYGFELGQGAYGLDPWTGDDNTGDRAINDALANLKGINVNLSVAWYERRQTATFVANNVRRVTTIFKMARRRWWVKQGRKVWKRLRNIPPGEYSKKLAEWWLEYEYAFRPLVSDIQGALKHIEKLDNGSYDRYVIKATGRAATKRKYTFEQSATVFGGPVTFYWENLYSQRSTKVVLYYTIDNSTYRPMTALGLTDPLLTAWELIPYSFVADWALPIGDFLEAAGADRGMKFRGGSSTSYSEWGGTRKIKSEPFIYGPWKGFPENATTHDHKEKSFNRVVLANSPKPRILYLKNPVSTRHIADAAALLRMFFANKH